MIYTPETSANILAAMQSIQMSNNGWSWIDNDDTLIKALQTAGYTIIETAAGVKAFSRRAQEALAADYKAHGAASFAVPTYGTTAPKEHAPDYEGMILARQERFLND
jgi:TRAP-type C4-dicarboxylate transport system substrate-binding protein